MKSHTLKSLPEGVPPIVAVAADLLIIYVVYTIARAEYLLENWSYFSQSVVDGRLWTLFKAGVVFDTP